MADRTDESRAAERRGLGQGAALAAESAGTRSNSAILGDIVWLMMRAPLYRKWSVAGVERYVMPAIQHRQFRLYHRENVPIGYVSWAFFTPEVEKKFVTGKYALKPEDWVGGEIRWIVDFIAPFGDTTSIRMNLRRERPYGGNGIVRAIRPYKDGRGVRIVEFGPYEPRHEGGWNFRVVDRD